MAKARGMACPAGGVHATDVASVQRAGAHDSRENLSRGQRPFARLFGWLDRVRSMGGEPDVRSGANHDVGSAQSHELPPRDVAHTAPAERRRWALLACMAAATKTNVVEWAGVEGYCGGLLYLKPGALAQLGERLVCNQEVAGSIPVRSIDYPAILEYSGSGFFSPLEKEVCVLSFQSEVQNFLESLQRYQRAVAVVD